ncbi:MAG TPA: CocE/NonD family hydrolase [Candidatus Kapabacteria bacterium]|nr:CocE/NonD family hydrolase [Candidatus Kapabacteria bacterium]
MVRFVTVLVLVLCVATVDAAAQSATRYTPISIPTRDGKTLAADLYSTDTSVARPTILVQTPYNKNYYRLAINIPPQAGGSPFPWDSAHYNYVVLDWRGFYGSTGADVAGYDRGLDGYDAVEWIASQSWCNQKVGTWGPSALGAIQFMTAKHHPPHLVCSVPLVKDFKTKYTDDFYGGVFRREHIETLQTLGLASVDLVLAHPTDDITWQVVERTSDYPDSIAVPMLLISGWFDHFPDDVIRAYYDLRSRSAEPVRARHRLMMGPWMHEGVGKAQQGVLTFPNAAGVSDTAALRFFDYFMRDIANGYENEPDIRYYQMGTNEWRSTQDWYGLARQADTMRLYLITDGVLRTALPPGLFPPDTVRYDPRNPSPTYGGSRLVVPGTYAPAGPQDVTDTVEGRGDVLIYTTPAATEPIEIQGGVTISLSAASDRTDTDFGVRLCDVDANGRSILLTQGIQRLRFRNGLAPKDTAAATPGTVYTVNVVLQNIAHTIMPGHRLRIDITGSNFPAYDLNPNTGGPLYKPGDTLVATNVVHCDGQGISSMSFPVARRTTSVPVAALDGTALGEATPNPFNAGTSIRFTLAQAAHVRLAVYDMLGNQVAELLDAARDAGAAQILWQPSDAIPAGTYICRLYVGDRVLQRSMVLVR